MKYDLRTRDIMGVQGPVAGKTRRSVLTQAGFKSACRTNATYQAIHPGPKAKKMITPVMLMTLRCS